MLGSRKTAVMCLVVGLVTGMVAGPASAAGGTGSEGLTEEGRAALEVALPGSTVSVVSGAEALQMVANGNVDLSGLPEGTAGPVDCVLIITEAAEEVATNLYYYVISYPPIAVFYLVDAGADSVDCLTRR